MNTASASTTTTAAGVIVDKDLTDASLRFQHMVKSLIKANSTAKSKN